MIKPRRLIASLLGTLLAAPMFVVSLANAGTITANNASSSVSTTTGSSGSGSSGSGSSGVKIVGYHPTASSASTVAPTSSNGSPGSAVAPLESSGYSAPAAQGGSSTDQYPLGASSPWSQGTAFAGSGFSNTSPSDSYLSVSLTQVVETTNSQFQVLSHSGSVLDSVGYGSFFNLGNGWTPVDGRVYYDVATQHWFMSVMAYDNSTPANSEVFLAVSSTSDATGSWTIFQAESATGTLMDQPKLGVYGAKIIIATNNLQGWYPGHSGNWLGSQLLVINKAELLSNLNPSSSPNPIPTGVATTTFGPNQLWNGGALPVVPTPAQAQSMGASDSSIPVIGDAGGTGSQMTIDLISGVPGVGSGPQQSFSYPALNPPYVSGPSSVPEPSGSIDGADHRLVTSSWQGSTIWSGTDTTCTPSGDNSSRSCLWLVDLNLGSMTAAQGVFGQSGENLIYPGLAQGAGGTVAVVATESSSSTYPTPVFMTLQNGSFSQASPLTILGNEQQ